MVDAHNLQSVSLITAQLKSSPMNDTIRLKICYFLLVMCAFLCVLSFNRWCV